jgi:hypothetical protein
MEESGAAKGPKAPVTQSNGPLWEPFGSLFVGNTIPWFEGDPPQFPASVRPTMKFPAPKQDAWGFRFWLLPTKTAPEVTKDISVSSQSFGKSSCGDSAARMRRGNVVVRRGGVVVLRGGVVGSQVK